MREHMIREERVLFPWLRRLEKPGAIMTGPPWSVQRPISCMEHDHDSAGAALARMRRMTNDFTLPADACNSYRALYQSIAALERDTHVHIHKENNILFPAGVRAEAGRDTERARA
jgi:regulator of cell morphogenesis and NO signaling